MELKHISGPWESIYGSHGQFDIRSMIEFQEPGTNIKYRPLITSVRLRDPVETADTARVIAIAPEGLGLAAMIVATATADTPKVWIDIANDILRKAQGLD